MSRASIILLGLLLALGAALFAEHAHTEDVSLDALRRKLVSARDPLALDEVLDALADRIGKQPGFDDAEAFGDWLGRLPEEIAKRPRVRLRRGWAYLAAGRGEDAKREIESVVRAGGEDEGVALAYLGEACRQQGDLVKAFEHLEAAVARGYRDDFVVECAHKSAFQMRETGASKEAESLPSYAVALERLVTVLDHPTLRTAIARWLLDDYGAYAIPGRGRAKTWARTAARHALAVLPGEQPGSASAKLAFDAAAALEPEDRASGGRTLRYDMLAWAYVLGNKPDQDAHLIPAAISHLAEAALAEGRYVLAHRLARERLDISDSPAARRVLASLPPDVGE
jgi:tetratricopeptide (TPR) repeat protein